jgi:FAD/FMN-containing dehydrogenase
MRRRDLIRLAALLPLTARAADVKPASPKRRVRPSDPDWPSETDWAGLKDEVGGRLLRPRSPFERCAVDSNDAACHEALVQLRNPYFLGDEPALTQTSGWVDAWRSRPSAYAVAAERSSDVAAAVNFARDRHLRLVVKGGGHSYQGTSCAPDSLLVWMRHMNAVRVHDAFVPQGCEGCLPAQPAVSVGAGALWMDAYEAVTTRAGRYVQGGGCTTVGVAGLVQSGGFGSFSKAYGTAAAGLIEAEIVTADGQVRVVNSRLDPDLYWAVRGGGGGTFGVVTRLTLRTHELPATFGGLSGVVRAHSDAAYRRLIAEVLRFYASALFNPHWGEQIRFRRSNTLGLSMVFQGLTQQQAQETWAPFLAWVRAQPDINLEGELTVRALPARQAWDPALFDQYAPQAIVHDARAGARPGRYLWADDQEQVGWFLHGYQSLWLPGAMLGGAARERLVEALFAATRHWSVGLHFNKGLAGADPAVIAAARDTATNPQVLEAFALAIIASAGDAAFEGMPGAVPNLSAAREEAQHISQAAAALRQGAPEAGSYVSESDYFLSAWQSGFWGAHYPRLLAVKRRYDPTGLFFVHHGVGSEAWSEDGFTRTHG